MSGVIDEDGTQWERCNGCINWYNLTAGEGFYERPTEKFEYGRDLCAECWAEVLIHGPGVDITPDPEALRLIEETRERMAKEMEGKEYKFTQTAPNTWDVEIVEVEA